MLINILAVVTILILIVSTILNLTLISNIALSFLVLLIPVYILKDTRLKQIEAERRFIGSAFGHLHCQSLYGGPGCRTAVPSPGHRENAIVRAYQEAISAGHGETHPGIAHEKSQVSSAGAKGFAPGRSGLAVWVHGL